MRRYLIRPAGRREKDLGEERRTGEQYTLLPYTDGVGWNLVVRRQARHGSRSG